MIKEILTKVYFSANDIFAQVYYPVFERQYIDPLTYKEKREGLADLQPSSNGDSLMLVLVMSGIILFALLIVLTFNYYKKKKRMR